MIDSCMIVSECYSRLVKKLAEEGRYREALYTFTHRLLELYHQRFAENMCKHPHICLTENSLNTYHGSE